MKILILHRVPYFKIEYHRGISHDRHDVTYFGTDQALATLPPDLRCDRVSRPGLRPVFEEAQKWLARKPREFDRIISASEYELLDAALLREHLGVPGAPPAQVVLARDKVLMKQAVEDAGLRVPRFLPLPQFLADEGLAPWHGRTVLKPHRGASSEDVLVFDTTALATTAIREGRTGIARLDAGKDRETFQVEEFVSGPIRHFDGLVQGGEVLVLSASEYINTCLQYSQGRPLGSFQIGFSDETRAWVARALAAVRIEDGSFHLEAIVQDGELVFLEVGNRVGEPTWLPPSNWPPESTSPHTSCAPCSASPSPRFFPSLLSTRAGTAGSPSPATTCLAGSTGALMAGPSSATPRWWSPGMNCPSARRCPITSRTRPGRRFSPGSSRATPWRPSGTG